MTESNENLIIRRTFDAPRDLVFDAWTRPELCRQWWGPKGFTCPVAKIELRPGGRYLNCMRSPEGKDFWSTGVYLDVYRPERLVMTDSFADERGNVVPATVYGMSSSFPREMVIRVEFAEESPGQTTLTLEHVGMPAAEHADCSKGWNESFDKLAEKLSEMTGERGPRRSVA